jgi:hypothetical protein
MAPINDPRFARSVTSRVLRLISLATAAVRIIRSHQSGFEPTCRPAAIGRCALVSLVDRRESLDVLLELGDVRIERAAVRTDASSRADHQVAELRRCPGSDQPDGAVDDHGAPPRRRGTHVATTRRRRPRVRLPGRHVVTPDRRRRAARASSRPPGGGPC